MLFVQKGLDFRGGLYMRQPCLPVLYRNHIDSAVRDVRFCARADLQPYKTLDTASGGRYISCAVKRVSVLDTIAVFSGRVFLSILLNRDFRGSFELDRVACQGPPFFLSCVPDAVIRRKTASLPPGFIRPEDGAGQRPEQKA